MQLFSGLHVACRMLNAVVPLQRWTASCCACKCHTQRACLKHDLARMQEHCYTSADSIVNDDQAHANGPVAMEVLNGMTPDSMPPHIIKLKAGCMVMLICNVHKDIGLVNGARLIVRAFQPHCVDCETASGVHKGRRVFIPSMVFNSDDESGLPLTLRRRQLPLRLAFAMTVNKSQGQTLRKVGLYLPNELFSHGQLYVALSRVSSENSIVVLGQEGVPPWQAGCLHQKFCV